MASKYEQVKALVDSSEFMHKHDSAMTMPALIEARKREESLKKAVGVKEACIASVSLLNIVLFLISWSLLPKCLFIYSNLYRVLLLISLA